MRPFFLLIIMLLGPCGCAPKRSAGPAFDIPALLGKNISQVEATLGPAVDNATTAAPSATPVAAMPAADTTVEFARKTFEKDGQKLVVTYTKHNGEITKFEIGTDENSGMLKEEDKGRFLQIGNLKEDDPRYTVQYVEAQDKPFYYTGVAVKVKPIEHQVKFRIAGSSDLVVLNYEVRSPRGETKSESDLLTMPPWELAVPAVSGTYLSIDGMLFGKRRTPKPKFTLQIWVDGKVVKESSSTGARAQCSLLL